MELNSYFSIRFDSIRNEHNYLKFLNTYCHRFLTYLTEWCRFFTLATTPSNQQNLLITMVQVLYLLEVFTRILAHYGPPSTETPITTIVRCHKNSWIYLASTYYWWLLRPTITIPFDSKFQIIAQLIDLIWFEMKKHYSHSTRWLFIPGVESQFNLTYVSNGSTITPWCNKPNVTTV